MVPVRIGLLVDPWMSTCNRLVGRPPDLTPLNAVTIPLRVEPPAVFRTELPCPTCEPGQAAFAPAASLPASEAALHCGSLPGVNLKSRSNGRTVWVDRGPKVGEVV